MNGDRELVEWLREEIDRLGIVAEDAAAGLGLSGRHIRRLLKTESGQPVKLSTKYRKALAAARDRSAAGHDWTVSHETPATGGLTQPIPPGQTWGYVEGLTRAADAMRIVIQGIDAEATRIRRESEEIARARSRASGSPAPKDASHGNHR